MKLSQWEREWHGDRNIQYWQNHLRLWSWIVLHEQLEPLIKSLKLPTAKVPVKIGLRQNAHENLAGL
jgi:hypothetical protein